MRLLLAMLLLGYRHGVHGLLPRSLRIGPARDHFHRAAVTNLPMSEELDRNLSIKRGLEDKTLVPIRVNVHQKFRQELRLPKKRKRFGSGSGFGLGFGLGLGLEGIRRKGSE